MNAANKAKLLLCRNRPPLHGLSAAGLRTEYVWLEQQAEVVTDEFDLLAIDGRRRAIERLLEGSR